MFNHKFSSYLIAQSSLTTFTFNQKFILKSSLISSQLPLYPDHSSKSSFFREPSDEQVEISIFSQISISCSVGNRWREPWIHQKKPQRWTWTSTTTCRCTDSTHQDWAKTVSVEFQFHLVFLWQFRSSNRQSAGNQMGHQIEGLQRTGQWDATPQHDHLASDHPNAIGNLVGSIQRHSPLYQPQPDRSASTNDCCERFPRQLPTSSNHATVSGSRSIPRQPTGSEVRRLLLSCRCQPTTKQLIKMI